MAEKKLIFGIDLGTTYSCIAYVDENGQPTVVKNGEGSNITPSVVYFEDTGNIIAGRDAKDSMKTEPDRSIAFVKRQIGREKLAITVDGKDYTPEEISAYILKKITNDASKLLDTEVRDVVITCPAYFGTQEREATKNAGIIAGLNVIEIISEPTAAAIYYGVAKSQKAKTVLVYDLGGGTFDVTVIAIDDEGKITVVYSTGDHTLGGKDWDEVIKNDMMHALCEANVLDESEISEETNSELVFSAEEVKQKLTSHDKARETINVDEGKIKFEISRVDFEDKTEHLIEQTIDFTKEAIEGAKKKGFSIDEILLVGGSTRMPQVENKLSEFGIEIKHEDPDEAVAKGAAIYALGAYAGLVEFWAGQSAEKMANLSEEEKNEAANYAEEASVSLLALPGLKGHKMTEIVTVATTKSYAVEVLQDDKPICFNMIQKNVPLQDGKYTFSSVFGTHEDNQDSAQIKVYETDVDEEYFEIPGEDFVLGEAELKLSGKLPAGSKLEVTFTLDREGILKVTGKDLTDGNVIEATMKAHGDLSMTKEEVQAAKEKSKGLVVM